MTDITAFEANDALDGPLERVERGEEVVITRSGKPVARLAPLFPSARTHDQSAAQAAADRILERSKRLTLGDLSIRELIDEGRKY